MLGHVLAWPELFDVGYGTAVTLPPRLKRVERIVVCAMGGSGIGAALAGDYLAAELKVPFAIHRDYDVPEYVDQRTLVICISHSGSTEETRSAYAAAQERKAPVLAVTTGGPLAEDAQRDKAALVTYVSEIPPRAATPYTFGLMLKVLVTLGFVPDCSEAVKPAVEHLRELANTARSTQRHFGAELAERLNGRIPVVYSAGLLTEAGRRFKGELAENAKQTAAWDVLPEQNHNGIVGLEYPDSLGRQAFFVLLRTDLERPRHALRFEFLREQLDRQHLPHVTIQGSGPNRLAHQTSVIFWGDLASCELAKLNGVDPSPNEVIDSLKARLAEDPQ